MTVGSPVAAAVLALLPPLQEVAHCVVDTWPGEDIGAGSHGRLAFEVVDHGKPQVDVMKEPATLWRLSLLAFSKAQRGRIGLHTTTQIIVRQIRS